jgi:glutamate transport system permease protein
MASVLIALIKNTTVAYAIGVAETAAFMRDGLEFRPDLSFLIFVLVAGFFVLLTMPLGIALTHLSQRLAVKR